jgi:hypothetical protein
MRRGRAPTSLASTFLLLAASLGAGAATAQEMLDPSVVPTQVDTVKRGLRMRTDLWGRYNTVGLPAPPVRLDVDDVVNDGDDLDVQGLVIFGYDRPFGMPIAADLMGDVRGDVGGDSPVSPFLDEYSAVPRLRLYSAFIGLSGGPGEALEPFKLNIGRMTELVGAPITYDGISTGVNLKFPKLGWLNAKLWGGLDAPQSMANDPFTRIDPRAYSEAYVDNSGFVSPTGGAEIERTTLVDPILNFVGGLNVEGRFAGVGFVLNHTLMPTLQRSRLGASYAWEADLLSFFVGADVKASDFLPNNVGLRGDLLTGDGTTRVGFNTSMQFFEDICAYDCTFRAFNPAAVFVRADAELIETFRVRDQIRHLNIGPAQEHVAAMLDLERQLPFGFSALLRGRLRQHFDDADLDYFRTNVLEGGAGLSWSSGFALDVGAEIVAGTLDSGEQQGLSFDLLAEGVQTYLENRVYVRTVLLEGKLSNLAEVFVRRQDIETKAIIATGQWSAGFATTLRYDVLDFWSMTARLEADALSPIDTLNGSGYLGGLVGTSLRF